MITKINHVVIFVTNMQASIDFYTDILGLQLQYQSDSYSSIGLSGETSIGLHIADSVAGIGSSGATTQVSFLVGDIDEAYSHLKGRGVNILRDIEEIAPGRKLFNFADPDNNSLSCYSIKENN